VSAVTLGIKGSKLKATHIIREGHKIKLFEKDVSIFWLIGLSAFSYQRNWHGRGELGETLEPKIVPLPASSGKGKISRPMER
jgi:hypothetical protein